MERLGLKQHLKGAFGAIPVCGLITICLEVGLAFLHRGGSVEKHLIHFAILLLAAWGMVLLYGAVPSVRRIWKRIDKRILSAETRKPWVDIVYAALAMILLLHHFYVLLYYPKIPAGASRFAPAWIPFAVITVLMGKLWRNKGFWICAVFAAYMFERTYLKEPNMSGETMVYMVSMIYALVICYGLMDVIRPEYRRTTLRVLCALWTLGTLVFCGGGLYFAWTGEVIQNLGGGKTELVMTLVKQDKWVEQARLSIFSNSNITGGIAAGGAVFALIGFAVTKNYVSKFLYIAACFLMMVTNALAATRSCFIMLAFATAGMITLGLWGVMKKHAKVRSWGNIPLAIGLIVCLGGCFWGSYTIQQKLVNEFVRLRDGEGLLTSRAQAEENFPAPSLTPIPEFADRDILESDFDFQDLFIGLDEYRLNKYTSWRYSIWKTAYEYVEEHPKTTYLGLSANGGVAEVVNPRPHCHNILIQIFMEGGIPSITLFLGLLGYFFFHSCRLWKRGTLPLWQRALPIPVLAVLVMEMVECLSHFAYGHVPMTILYFFIGATIAVSGSIDRKEKGDKTLNCAQNGTQAENAIPAGAQ